MRALINLNDETGKDLFSVECEDDIGNWLESFESLEEAEYFINARLMLHVHDTDFRDTRMVPNAQLKAASVSESSLEPDVRQRTE